MNIIGAVAANNPEALDIEMIEFVYKGKPVSDTRNSRKQLRVYATRVIKIGNC